MAQTDSPHTPDATAVPAEDDDALRKRLLSRIAVAGVAIVGLLGGLAVYDAMNKPQTPDLPKMAAVEEPKPAAVPEEKPVEEKAEEKLVEEKVAEVVPERTETPVVPPQSEKPQEKPQEKPLKPAKPLTAPATAKPATARPSTSGAPVTAPVKPDAEREIARVIPESTRPAPAPPSRPLTRTAEAAKRFLVQVGVFSNHANAEELVTRLTQAGIPAQIESRVQVGPFASRAEADAAREKLKSMGLDDGLLVRR